MRLLHKVHDLKTWVPACPLFRLWNYLMDFDEIWY
jgi:hypothetical protein